MTCVQETAKCCTLMVRARSIQDYDMEKGKRISIETYSEEI